MRKRGAVNWMIGKLLNIILLVIVLVLVVYGMTTGGLNPLIDNMGMKFDEVKILLGLEDSFYEGCYTTKIVDMGGGKEFLASLGVSGLDAVLNVCRNGVCNVSSKDFGTYRVIDGVVDRLEGKVWRSLNFGSVDGIVVGKSDWERYDSGVGLLEKTGMKDIYDNAFTKRFVLYGDGNRLNNEDIYAVWQNGEWAVQKNEEKVVYFDNDKDAIEEFIKLQGNVDDKVYWVINEEVVKMNEIEVLERGEGFSLGSYEKDVCKSFCPHGGSGTTSSADIRFNSKTCNEGVIRNAGICCCSHDQFGFDVIDDKEFKGKPIGDLVGNIGFGSSYSELDSEEEVNKLKSELEGIKKSLIKEAKISEEELGKMENVLVGKKVSIGGEDFIVSLSKGYDFPIVVFSSKTEEFGLKFAAFAKVDSSLLERVDLRYYPVYLVKWDGSEWKKIGDEEVYRLPEKNFKEIYREDFISKFLRQKCK